MSVDAMISGGFGVGRHLVNDHVLHVSVMSYDRYVVFIDYFLYVVLIVE